MTVKRLRELLTNHGMPDNYPVMVFDRHEELKVISISLEKNKAGTMCCVLYVDDA